LNFGTRKVEKGVVSVPSEIKIEDALNRNTILNRNTAIKTLKLGIAKLFERKHTHTQQALLAPNNSTAFSSGVALDWSYFAYMTSEQLTNNRSST
jgi:hypothetical protein